MSKSEVQAQIRQQIKDEKARMKKFKLSDFGPLVHCRFTNLESKGVSLEFSMEGIKFGPYEDGKEYDVPQGVVEHCNSLSTPKMEYRASVETGQMQSVEMGRNYRYAFTPAAAKKAKKAA